MPFSFLHSLTKPAKLLIPFLEWWLSTLLSIAVAFSAVVLDLAYFLDSECRRTCMEFQAKPHTHTFRPLRSHDYFSSCKIWYCIYNTSFMCVYTKYLCMCVLSKKKISYSSFVVTVFWLNGNCRIHTSFLYTWTFFFFKLIPTLIFEDSC